VIFRLETLVIRVLDDAEPLGSVNNFGRDNFAVLGQTRGGLIQHSVDVTSAAAHEFGRMERGVRRRVVGDFLERTAALDRILHDERLKFAPLGVGHAQGCVDVIRADGAQLESLTRRRSGDGRRVLV
jgi:hypothetical protein